MTDLPVPTVHLNGTSADHLMEALSKARLALRDALEAIRATAPNGRDYYPQGPDAFTAAANEHYFRIQKVLRVHDDLGSVQMAIDAQITQRARDTKC